MSDSDLLSTIWLKPIIGLVQNREFDEAYALAGYFPATPGRRLIECAALLGQDELAKADILLKALPLEMHSAVANSRVLAEDGIDFLEVGDKAFMQKYFYAANFCLEIGLSTHPEAAQAVIEGMLDSAAQVLAVGDLDLGKAYLKRVLQIDASPSRLLQWAQAALVNRQAGSAQSLSEFARELIERALGQVPEEDVENRLKAAKLLAIDAQTFEAACELLRQLLRDCPLAGVQVSDLLLPLVDYKPYFSDIADFLLEVDPGNVAPLAEKLVKAYRRSRNSSYLQKAQSLLDALDYAGHGRSLQLARAVLTVGRESDDFESYARRLAGLEVSPDISLEAAQILVKNETLDYALVTRFLEQTLQCDPGQRARVLQAYVRLSKLTEGRGQPNYRERFFRRAVSLSTNLKEFLDLGVGGRRADQLLTVISDEQVLSEAPWYSHDEASDMAQSLIMRAVPRSRSQVLYALLDQYERIPASRLTYWLDMLFQMDLELTEHDVEQIQSKIALLTPNWHLEVQKRLTKHLTSKARKELEQLHLAKLCSDRLDNVGQKLGYWLQRASQEPGWPRRMEVERLESVRRGLERLQSWVIKLEHASLELQEWVSQANSRIEQLERAVVGLEPEQLEFARRELESSSLGLMRRIERTSEELARLKLPDLETERLEDIGRELDRVMANLVRLEQTGAEPAQVRDVVSTLAHMMLPLEVWLERATTDWQRVMVVDASVLGAAADMREMRQSEMREMWQSEMASVVGEVLAEEDSMGKPDLAESKHPTAKIQRHTRIDFPAQCVLERKVDLRIQLTRDVPKLTRVLKKMIVLVHGSVEQVTLDVHITAPGFALQQWHKPLVLPVSGDSEEIVFTLVPLELGEQVVEIEFFHEASRVGYVLVTTDVEQWSRPEAAPNMLLVEDPVDRIEREPAAGTDLDRRILHVSWSDREGRLYYTIYSPNPRDFGEWQQSGPNVKEQITDYLRELNAFLTEVATKGSPAEKQWDSLCFNMQAVGGSLFEALIPSPVAERVQKWQPGSSVIVSTNEQWVPWELVYDGEDFWGRKFILARYPRLSDRRSLPDANRPEGKRRKRIRHIVNVVGGGVPGTEAYRAAQLFKTLLPSTPAGLVRLLQEEPVSVLQKALAGVDVLHFTCHGHLEPHMLQIAGDKSRTQNLLPQTIRKLALEPGSFVFANACASSAPVLTFGKFSNFGWEFYRQGADIFIGTLGTVPAKYAVSFAEAVYRELFKKDTQPTIGQAMAAAKETAAGDHNLFWLLYCIYGEPNLSIQVS